MQSLHVIDFDPEASSGDQLLSILRRYDFDGDELPLGERERAGLVDVGRVIRMLPRETDAGGVNSAREVLQEYLDAVPPKLRLHGLFQRPEHLVSLFLDRLEFFEGLSRHLVRMCRGRDCPNFNVCPYKNAPGLPETTLYDSVPCAVERDVVKRAVADFVTGRGDQPAKIDPRRPAEALLFRQLVECLVKNARYGLYLQEQDVLIDQWEILKVTATSEQFETKNQRINPLADAYERNAKEIARILRDLGITPEFEKKNGFYESTDPLAGFEARQREMTEARLRMGLSKALDAFPEGSREREQLALFIGIPSSSSKEVE